VRPSHAICFVAGIFTTIAHQQMSAPLMWGAIGMGLLALWCIWFEGNYR